MAVHRVVIALLRSDQVDSRTMRVPGDADSALEDLLQDVTGGCVRLPP